MDEYAPNLGIVVLTNDIYQPTQLSDWVNDDLALMRLDAAALLYFQQLSLGDDPCIIVSGGHIRGKEHDSLAEVGRNELYKTHWIPHEHVLKNLALDTIENAVYSKDQLDFEEIEECVAITNGFHVPRAQYCFDWLGRSLGVRVISAEDVFLSYFPDLEEALTDFRKLPEIQRRVEEERKNLEIMRFFDSRTYLPSSRFCCWVKTHAEMLLRGERKQILPSDVYKFRDVDKIKAVIDELRGS